MRTIILGWLLPGCVIGEIHEGNGRSATEDRAVDAFSGVIATMSIPVDVVAGPAPAVTVTCDANLLEFIDTDVEGGDLIVRSTPDGDRFVAIEPTVDCRVEITTDGVARLVVTGSGPMTVTGDDLGGLGAITSTGSGGLTIHGTAVNGDVAVTSTGSGGIDLDGIVAGSTAILQSGSGPVAVRGGTTDTLALTMTGSGGLDAAAFVAGDLDATVSGSGGGEVTVTDSVEATLTGSGGLVIHGDPVARDVTSTGSGDVTFE